MSKNKLIKLAPTGALIGYLGYAFFSLQPIPVNPARAEKALEKKVIELLVEGAEMTDALKGQIKDPFWAPPPPGEAPAKPNHKEVVEEPASDPVAEIVRGMSLDATFLHGRDQLAIIDGRIYTRGQSLSVSMGEDEPARELKVLFVTRTGVILRGDKKNYALGYPTELRKMKDKDDASGSAGDPALAEIQGAGQAEMFAKLLDSPLGAMGRSLLGQAGKKPDSGRGKAGAAKDRAAKRSSSGR